MLQASAKLARYKQVINRTRLYYTGIKFLGRHQPAHIVPIVWGRVGSQVEQMHCSKELHAFYSFWESSWIGEIFVP